MVNPEPRLTYTNHGLLYVVFELIKAGVVRGARNEGFALWRAEVDGESEIPPEKKYTAPLGEGGRSE